MEKDALLTTLKKSSTAKGFMIGTLVFALVLVLVAVGIYRSMGQINASIDSLLSSSGNNQGASYIVTSFLRADELQTRYIFAASAAEREKIYPDLADEALNVKAGVRALSRFFTTDEQKAEVDGKIRPAVKEWAGLNEEIIDLVDRGHAQDAFKLKATRGTALTSQVMGFLTHELTTLNEKVIEAEHKATTRKIRDAIRQFALACALSLALGIAIVVLVSRRIMGVEVQKEKQQVELYKMAAVKEKQQAQLAQMGKEMEIATRIQTALIPTDTTVPDYEMSMELITATEVGGDMIDYFPQEDGRYWLAVGDVTGHGLTPGLVMMMAQSMFTALVAEDPDASPSELLSRLNQTLHQNVKYRLRNDNYMTLQVIHHLGDGRFVAAGMHCDVLIYRAATGKVDLIETQGFWTGFVPDVREMTFDYTFEMAPNDVMLLYTDGLIEAKNADEEQYDMERLEAALARYAHLEVDEIKARILAEVRAWMSEQLDDISIVVLRRQESAALEARV
ncbi:MAG TPA: PP2C family protein-serine/threonine phosphatase [Pantanalinema sp.]